MLSAGSCEFEWHGICSSFTDDEGTTHTVRYIADDKGYRVTGRSSVAGPKVAQPAPTPAPIPVPAPVPVPAPTPVYYIVRAPTSFHGSAYHSPIIASGNGAQPVYYIANGQPRYYSHFNSYYPGGQRFYFASY